MSSAVHWNNLIRTNADGPWIVAFHEIAAVDNAFILAYPFFIYFFAGWGWGTALIVRIVPFPFARLEDSIRAMCHSI